MKITSYHNQLALAIATEVHTSQRVPEVEDMLKALPTLHLNKQDTAPLIALASILKSLQAVRCSVGTTLHSHDLLAVAGRVSEEGAREGRGDDEGAWRRAPGRGGTRADESPTRGQKEAHPEPR